MFLGSKVAEYGILPLKPCKTPLAPLSSTIHMLMEPTDRRNGQPGVARKRIGTVQEDTLSTD